MLILLKEWQASDIFLSAPHHSLLFCLTWERFQWRGRQGRLIRERGLMQQSSETQGQMFPLVTAADAHIYPHTFSLLAVRTVLYLNTYIMKEFLVSRCAYEEESMHRNIQHPPQNNSYLTTKKRRYVISHVFVTSSFKICESICNM